MFASPARVVPASINVYKSIKEFAKFDEAAVRVIKNGKEYRAGSFKLFTEVKPKGIKLTRTSSGGFFEPEITFIKSKVVKTQTLPPPFRKVINQEEFITMSTKGTTQAKFEKVIPVESEFINPTLNKEFDSLSKIDKFLLQRIAEKKIGIPISLFYKFIIFFYCSFNYQIKIFTHFETPDFS